MKTPFNKHILLPAVMLVCSSQVMALTAKQQEIYDKCVQQQQATMSRVDQAARAKTGYVEVVNQQNKQQDPNSGSFLHQITQPPQTRFQNQNPNTQVPTCTDFLNSYANDLFGSILGALDIGGAAGKFIGSVASNVTRNQINNTLCAPVQNQISGTFNKFCSQAGQAVKVSASCNVSANGTLNTSIYGNTGGPVNIGGSTSGVFNPVSGTYSTNQGVTGPGASTGTTNSGNIYSPTAQPLQQSADPGFFSNVSNTVGCWFSSGPNCK